MTKNEARALALNLRKTKDNINASGKALDALISSKILEKYTNIGIYYPIGKEINITKLKDIYPNKNFYLPITKDVIYFAEYKDLVDGPFKTKEPTGKEVKRDNIECFIIPCVAISYTNQRIGYGKGYYDRYLDGYKGYKIGIVYEDCYLDVDCDKYDVVLDMIIKG